MNLSEFLKQNGVLKVTCSSPKTITVELFCERICKSVNITITRSNSNKELAEAIKEALE